MLSNTRKKQIALLQIHLFIYITLQNGLCLKKTKQIIPHGKIVLKKERGKKKRKKFRILGKDLFQIFILGK